MMNHKAIWSERDRRNGEAIFCALRRTLVRNHVLHDGEQSQLETSRLAIPKTSVVGATFTREADAEHTRGQSGAYEAKRCACCGSTENIIDSESDAMVFFCSECLIPISSIAFPEFYSDLGTVD